MSKIEQRAKAILGSINTPSTLGDYGYDSDSSIYFEEEVKDLLIAALTPPEGYVLVPSELLRMVVGCAYPVSSEIDPRGYSWSEAYLDEVLPQIKAAMLATRPEVKE